MLGVESMPYSAQIITIVHLLYRTIFLYVLLLLLKVVVNQKTGELKKIFVHVTNATDTENIQRVFNNVRDIIIDNLLNEYEFY